MFNIAKNLKFLMEERKLSNSNLSIKAGLGRNAVNDIIVGKSEDPKASTIDALAKALNCSIDMLLSNDIQNKFESMNYDSKLKELKWEPLLAEKCLKLVKVIVNEKNIVINTEQADIVLKDLYTYTIKKAFSKKNNESLNISLLEPDYERAEWIIEAVYRSYSFLY